MQKIIIVMIAAMAFFGVLAVKSGQKIVGCATQQQGLKLAIAEMRGNNIPESAINVWVIQQLGECRSVLGHKH